MALIPRWRYMTSEAKTMVRQAAVSVGCIMVGLLLLRAFLPWIVLGLIGWWLWKMLMRTS